MNAPHPDKVLIAIRDSVVSETLVDLISHCFDAQVTRAASGTDALDIDCIETHHVVIVGDDLDDLSQLTLATRILELRQRPVILIIDQPTSEDLLSALRVGVQDALPTPIEVQRLLDGVERGLHQDAANRRDQRRHERLRCLVRRVLRERRDLNERIDLICRDMVGAHRRLFSRILAGEGGASGLDITRD